VIQDAQGNLVGTTQFGGQFGRGTIFQLTPAKKRWRQKVLYSFCAQDSCADGAIPAAPVSIDSAGNIYGTTSAGGQYVPDGGTVFELHRRTFSTLHSFCQDQCTDGETPVGSVSIGASGELFGMTVYGGAGGGGTVFKLEP
jgi:uncharacterized repeat protein (TIGR03803 family)